MAFFRPRGSIRSFFKQYYLYARGDGKAGLFLKRHLIRYAIYLAVLPIMLLGLLVAPGVGALVCAGVLAAGAGLYLREPYRRLLEQWGALPRSQKLRAAAWVPLIRAAGDLAKMVGYPVGVLWRAQHRPGEAS